MTGVENVMLPILCARGVTIQYLLVQLVGLNTVEFGFEFCPVT